ncbi:hypothetical protein [Aquimarina litoralis]
MNTTIDDIMIALSFLAKHHLNNRYTKNRDVMISAITNKISIISI